LPFGDSPTFSSDLCIDSTYPAATCRRCRVQTKGKQMSQDLIFVTVVMVFTGFGVFLGYWSGVSKAEAADAAKIDHLLNELDEACETIADMLETSAISRHPSARSLSLVKDGA